MFPWPALELTPYELKFVRAYKEGNKKGVLRRCYEVALNSLADALTPGLESVHLQGEVQIARRNRIFGLQFAGALGSWRLAITTATGEQLTPTMPGADGPPVVSSLIAGSYYNGLASISDQNTVNPVATTAYFFGSHQYGALLLDPNWVFDPNDTLMFAGTVIANPVPPSPAGDQQKLLRILVHAWEFPGMEGEGE